MFCRFHYSVAVTPRTPNPWWNRSCQRHDETRQRHDTTRQFPAPIFARNAPIQSNEDGLAMSLSLSCQSGRHGIAMAWMSTRLFGGRCGLAVLTARSMLRCSRHCPSRKASPISLPAKIQRYIHVPHVNGHRRPVRFMVWNEAAEIFGSQSFTTSPAWFSLSTSRLSATVRCRSSIASSPKPCWSCEVTHSTDRELPRLFCPSCHKIQQTPAELDYFALFGWSACEGESTSRHCGIGIYYTSGLVQSESL